MSGIKALWLEQASKMEALAGFSGDPEPTNYPDVEYDNMYGKVMAFLSAEEDPFSHDTITLFRRLLTDALDLDDQLALWPREPRDRLLRYMTDFVEGVVEEDNSHAQALATRSEPDPIADYDRQLNAYLESGAVFPPDATRVFSLKKETGREDDSLEMQQFVAQSVRSVSEFDEKEQRRAKVLLCLNSFAQKGSDTERQVFHFMRKMAWGQTDDDKEFRGFVSQFMAPGVLDDRWAGYVRSLVSGTQWLPAGAGGSVLTSNPGPYDLPLGRDEAGRMQYFSGETSLITIAPMGSGKTLCHAVPALNRYQGPAVVLDIKGDCHAKSHVWRKRNVGPIYVLNPTRPDISAKYNPLAMVSEDENQVWLDAKLLADLLINVGNSKDPVWETHGKELLTLILAVVTLTEPLETRNMGKVLDYAATIGLDEMLEQVSEEGAPFPRTMRRTATRFHQMSQKAPKQFEGVLGGITQHMGVWEGANVETISSRCDWLPEDLWKAPYPTIYLNIPPDAVTTYAPLIRVLLGQHVRRLMREEGRAKAPILFMIDEMPRLGHMEPLREALEVGRSYGIKLWMIAQFREQVLAAYPDVGSGMIAATGVRLYMNPRFEAAQQLAKEFGETEGLFDDRKKPVLDPVAMTGPAYRDKVFVMVAGEQGRVLDKAFHQG